jgi:hypothetical protein
VAGREERGERKEDLALYHIGMSANPNSNPGLGVYYIEELGGPSPLKWG